MVLPVEFSGVNLMLETR